MNNSNELHVDVMDECKFHDLMAEAKRGWALLMMKWNMFLSCHKKYFAKLKCNSEIKKNINILCDKQKVSGWKKN